MVFLYLCFILRVSEPLCLYMLRFGVSVCVNGLSVLQIFFYIHYSLALPVSTTNNYCKKSPVLTMCVCVCVCVSGGGDLPMMPLGFTFLTTSSSLSTGGCCLANNSLCSLRPPAGRSYSKQYHQLQTDTWVHAHFGTWVHMHLSTGALVTLYKAFKQDVKHEWKFINESLS